MKVSHGKKAAGTMVHSGFRMTRNTGRGPKNQRMLFEAGSLSQKAKPQDWRI